MTPSGISTTGAGLETPDMIELRKRKTQIESDMESNAGGDTPALYKILPEKAANVGGSMMGSAKVYDISHAKKAALLQEAMIGGDDHELDMAESGEASAAIHFDASLQSVDKNKKKAQKKAPAQPAPATAADKEKNKKYKEFKF